MSDLIGALDARNVVFLIDCSKESLQELTVGSYAWSKREFVHKQVLSALNGCLGRNKLCNVVFYLQN